VERVRGLYGGWVEGLGEGEGAAWDFIAPTLGF